MALLDVKDLSIGFHMPGRDVQVVDKVSFALEQGETYLVAGYGAQQRYRLTLRNCRFVKSDAGSAFWTGSCTEPGASHGAPILATRGNALEVVGMTPASLRFTRSQGHAQGVALQGVQGVQGVRSVHGHSSSHARSRLSV